VAGHRRHRPVSVAQQGRGRCKFGPGRVLQSRGDVVRGAGATPRRYVLASREFPNRMHHANAQHDQPTLGSWTDRRTHA
jgi:hypothetical protein